MFKRFQNSVKWLARPSGSAWSLAMCVQQARVLREAEQVVLGQEVHEVLDREVLVVLFEFEEIELLTPPVVHIDGAGGGIFGMDLEEEDAARHLYPACGHR